MSTPTPLLDITVRPDWQEIAQRVARQRLRLRLALYAAVLAVAVAAQFCSWLVPHWAGSARIAFYCVLVWGFPLGALCYESTDRRAAAADILRLAGTIVPAIGLAILTAPLPLAAAASGLRLLGLLIPVAGAWTVWRMRRAFPHQMRAWGVNGGAWISNLLIGGAAGTAFGFHYWIVAGLVRGTPHTSASFVELIWMAGYLIGLRALGEELLLRGLGYHVLSMSGTKDASNVLRLALLSVMLIPWPVGENSSPSHWVIAIYLGMVALTASWLRWHQGSVVPGLICRVVFVLFVGTTSML